MKFRLLIQKNKNKKHAKHNHLISEKQKKACKYLSYIEHLFLPASTVTGCVSISTFDSLVDIFLSITNYSRNKIFVQPLQESKSISQL